MKNAFHDFISTVALAVALLAFCAPQCLAQSVPVQQAVYTGKDAQTAVAEALVKAGAGEDISVSVQGARDEDIIASGGAAITADLDGLEYDKSQARWQALLLLREDGRNLAPLKLSGHFDEMTRVPVLKQRMQAPEIISEDDIDWNREPSQHLRRNTVTDIHDLVGKSPRHMISPNRPIRSDEIAGPTVVNKGAQVTLLYKSTNLEIKTFGEAMESGAKGDVIRVRNQTSKAIIQGTVDSASRVLISSPESNAAEAM